MIFYEAFSCFHMAPSWTTLKILTNPMIKHYKSLHDILTSLISGRVWPVQAVCLHALRKTVQGGSTRWQPCETSQDAGGMSLCCGNQLWSLHLVRGCLAYPASSHGMFKLSLHLVRRSLADPYILSGDVQEIHASSQEMSKRSASSQEIFRIFLHLVSICLGDPCI